MKGKLSPGFQTQFIDLLHIFFPNSSSNNKTINLIKQLLSKKSILHDTEKMFLLGISQKPQEDAPIWT